MRYRLRCPACEATSEHVFVRLGAAAQCGACKRVWRIEAAHVTRESTQGRQVPPMSDTWALPAGQARSTAAASSSGRPPRDGTGAAGAGADGLGPGSGLPVGEGLGRDGSAEAMVAMSSLESVIGGEEDADGALTEPAELERELERTGGGTRGGAAQAQRTQGRRGWLNRLWRRGL